ncbi:MAG: sugar-transfer associated ATP-grasp domain-containing protein, partial [Pricia sp.]
LALNGGQGCFKLHRKNFREQLRAEYENLMDGDYIHTKALGQHNDIDHIYDKSINTLRILTFIEGSRVDIISSFLRIGAGGSWVDNGSSGGLFVGIEQDSGTLKKTGYRDMKFGGGEYERHPDTGFEFDGFVVPFFEEACELVKEAARHIPNRFIGWDVAITPNGPTLIEGNEDPHLFMSDVAYGGLLTNLHMKQVMSAV